MNGAAERRSGRPLWRLALSACAASMLLPWAGGCCGGRLVSVRLYHAAAGGCSHCAGLGCKNCLSGRFSGLRHRPGGWLAGSETDRGEATERADLRHRPGGWLAGSSDAGFRGPAFAAPLPRFHPVPTRPVFEPQDEYAPLKRLELSPAPAGDSIELAEPTPALPPGVSRP